MKRYLSIALLITTACMLQSFGQKKKAKKVGYEFPAAMAPNIQAEFTKLCDKGQILYDLNCGGCHNVMVKGKMVIPDFTQEQLNGYEIRMGNQDHESNLSEARVTTEELGLIFTFFAYKQKSGILVNLEKK